MEHNIKITWTQESNFEYEESNQKISLDIISEKGFSPKKLLLVDLQAAPALTLFHYWKK